MSAESPDASAGTGGVAPSPDRYVLPELLDLGPGLVKICGLRRPEHAVAAVNAGVDLLGFNFYAPARRRVPPELARDAIAAAKGAAGRRSVLAVGIFVDADADEINEVIDQAGLDLVQLHGDEPPSLLPRLTRPVIKVVRPPLGTPPGDVASSFARYMAVDNAPRLFLVEGFNAGAAGGVGAPADWTLARELATAWPICLAGGLTPRNIGAAIETVRPLAVDVASGVETDGEKDPVKIAAFTSAAKQAFVASEIASE